MASQRAMLMSEPAVQAQLTCHRWQVRRKMPQTGICQASLLAQPCANAKLRSEREEQDDAREILALPHTLHYPCALNNHDTG